MQNSSELDIKYLGKISSDFIKISDNLKETSYVIRKNGFSEYPIFPMCPVSQSIGQLLIEKSQLHNNWYYYASYLDEFIQRGLIENETVFKEKYKNPDEFCCLFVIDEQFTNFIYIPYPVD